MRAYVDALNQVTSWSPVGAMPYKLRTTIRLPRPQPFLTLFLRHASSAVPDESYRQNNLETTQIILLQLRMLWWDLRRLGSSNTETRLSAIRSLSRSQNPNAVEPLISRLTDPEKQVKIAAITALGELRDKRAVEPLLELLRSATEDLKIAATKALGSIADRSAVPALADQLAASALKNPSLAEVTVASLSELGGPFDDSQRAWVALAKKNWQALTTPAAIGPLLQVLNEGREFGEVQKCLSQIKDRAAVEPLVAALEQFHKQVVLQAIISALQSIADRRAVSPLIGCFRKCDASLSRAAEQALDQIDPEWKKTSAARQAVVQWIDDLRSENEDRRYEAARFLGIVPDQASIPPLINCLCDPIESVSRTALSSLDKVDQHWWTREEAKAILPQVLDVLKHDDQKMRVNAVRILEKLQDRQALPGLLRALIDPVPAVRKASERALGIIDPDWSKSDPAKASIPLFLAQLRQRKGIGGLIEARPVGSDEWWAEVCYEIFALAKIGTPEAVDALRQVLTEKSTENSYPAIRALGELKDLRAVPELVQTLSSENHSLRNAAAEALKKLRWQPQKDTDRARYRVALEQWKEAIQLGPVAIEALANALTNPTHEKAAQALGQIADARAAEALVNRLITCDGPPFSYVLQDALKKLGGLAIDYLVRGLATNTTRGRLQALKGLEALGWEPRDNEEKALKALAAQKWNEIAALGRYAVRAVLIGLNDPDFSVQTSAANCCDKLGKTALQEFIQRLSDPDKNLRKAAALALGGVQNHDVVEPLLAALNDDALEVKCAAAASLHQIGNSDARIFESVRPLLNSDNLELRWIATNVFAEHRYAEVEPFLDETVHRVLVQYRENIPEVFRQGKLAAKAGFTNELVDVAKEALTYRTENTDPKWENLRPSYLAGDDALRKLCASKTLYSTYILDLVTKKQDYTITLPQCIYTAEWKLDFSKQRQIAKEELAKRGFSG